MAAEESDAARLRKAMIAYGLTPEEADQVVAHREKGRVQEADVGAYLAAFGRGHDQRYGD